MPDLLRPTPFDLIFSAVAGDSFPGIRQAVVESGVDPQDRDALFLLREAAECLHRMRPDNGIGEGIAELAALLHMVYLFWTSGQRVAVLAAEPLALVMETDPGPPARRDDDLATYYLQLPGHRVWGSPVEGASAEPLDGWFVSARETVLHAVAVFGLHPARQGLTVVEVVGARPQGLARHDGSPLFAPALAGGEAAGLHSITGMEELLALAWRAHAFLAARAPLATGVTVVTV